MQAPANADAEAYSGADADTYSGAASDSGEVMIMWRRTFFGL